MNWSNPLYYTNTIENNTINQSRRAHSSLRTACNCHVAPRACVSSCLARRCLIWFVTIRSLPARYPFLHATACQMRCVCKVSTLRDCTSSPSRCLELGRRSQTRKTRKTWWMHGASESETYVWVLEWVIEHKREKERERGDTEREGGEGCYRSYLIWVRWQARCSRSRLPLLSLSSGIFRRSASQPPLQHYS